MTQTVERPTTDEPAIPERHGRHTEALNPQSGELHQVRPDDALVEQLRAETLNPNHPRELEGLDREALTALDLAELGQLAPEAGRELIGMLAAQIDTPQHPLTQVVAELKTAVYGTSQVVPMASEAKISHRTDHPAYQAREARAVLEWHGSPIQLLPGIEDQDLPGSPDTLVTLRLGPEDTWYVQVGNQDPRPLPSGQVTSYGRVDLGGHTLISRNHFSLEPQSPIGIVVTDHSTEGTTVRTTELPDPRDFREQTHHGVKKQRIEDAREYLEKAS